MTIQSLNLLPAAPEIFVLVMVCTILVVDLFLDEAHRHWSYVLTLLTLALAAVITLVGGGPERAPCVQRHVRRGPDGAGAEGVHLHLRGCDAGLRARVHAVTAACSEASSSRSALFATLGMMVMVSASHFLTLYLGLELMSLSLYSHGGAVAGFGHRHGGGHEVLRARRAGLGHAAVRPVHDLRRYRQPADRGGRQPHRRASRRTRRCWSSAWCSSSRDWASSSARAVSHVGAGRLPGRAHCRDPADRQRARARGLRLRAAHPGRGARRPGAAAPVARDADPAVGAVDGDRQRHRHRADQHQAHARLLHHLPHGLHAARHSERHGERLRRGDVLHRRSTC